MNIIIVTIFTFLWLAMLCHFFKIEQYLLDNKLFIILTVFFVISILY